MGTTGATSSILIDAPVERVFAFVADPASLLSALGTSRLERVETGPDGVVTRYDWTAQLPMLPRPVHGTQTRLELVVDHRIVESASTGPVLTLDLEPVGGATRLTMTEQISTRIPFGDKLLQFIGTQGRGLARKEEQILREIKQRVES